MQSPDIPSHLHQIRPTQTATILKRHTSCLSIHRLVEHGKLSTLHTGITKTAQSNGQTSLTSNVYSCRFNPEHFPELTKERFAELQGAFSFLDKDDIGYIKARDLKNAFKFMGQTK